MSRMTTPANIALPDTIRKAPNVDGEHPVLSHGTPSATTELLPPAYTAPQALFDFQDAAINGTSGAGNISNMDFSQALGGEIDFAALNSVLGLNNINVDTLTNYLQSLNSTQQPKTQQCTTFLLR